MALSPLHVPILHALRSGIVSVMGGKGPRLWRGRRTPLGCRSLQVAEQLGAGSWAAPRLCKGDESPRPQILCAGKAKPLPPFQGYLRNGAAEGEGMKKKNKYIKTPSIPTSWHQGRGDKARCRICSWCKLDASRVRRM